MAPMLSNENSSPPRSAISDQSQQSLSHVPPTVGAAAGANNKLIIALTAIVALLIVGVVAVVLLKPDATGLLMISVPDAVAITATLNIDGKAILDDSGNALKEWPQMRALPVGKHAVLLRAPGYETLMETIEVREGNEPAQLKGELKKK